MSKEAMKLALEALENSIDLVEQDYDNAVSLYGNYPSRAKRLIGMETMRDDHRKAITAIREALAEQPAQRDIRNATLDEIATKIEAMPFGDTAASFAVWIREQKA